MAGELAVRVGERIRQRREELGIKTQRELAERLKLPTVGNQAISVYERGEALPKDGRLALIAEALEVPVGYFFEEPEPPEEADLLGALHGDQEDVSGRLDQIEQAVAGIVDTVNALRDSQDKKLSALDRSLQKLLEQQGPQEGAGPNDLPGSKDDEPKAEPKEEPKGRRKIR